MPLKDVRNLKKGKNNLRGRSLDKVGGGIKAAVKTRAKRTDGFLLFEKGPFPSEQQAVDRAPKSEDVLVKKVKKMTTPENLHRHA